MAEPPAHLVEVDVVPVEPAGLVPELVSGEVSGLLPPPAVPVPPLVELVVVPGDPLPGVEPVEALPDG